MHTSLRALVLVAFYCVLALFKSNGTTTSSSVSPWYQHGVGCFGLGVFFTNILPSSVRIGVRARSVGFCCTKFSLARWSKHGSTLEMTPSWILLSGWIFLGIQVLQTIYLISALAVKRYSSENELATRDPVDPFGS